jgi:hypothetical protein
LPTVRRRYTTAADLPLRGSLNPMVPLAMAVFQAEGGGGAPTSLAGTHTWPHTHTQGKPDAQQGRCNACRAAGTGRTQRLRAASLGVMLWGSSGCARGGPCRRTATPLCLARGATAMLQQVAGRGGGSHAPRRHQAQAGTQHDRHHCGTSHNRSQGHGRLTEACV